MPISRPKIMAVPVLWHPVPQFGPCQLLVLFSGDDCPWRGKEVGCDFSGRWHFLIVESFIPAGDAEFHRVDMLSHKAWFRMVRTCERCGRPQGAVDSSPVALTSFARLVPEGICRMPEQLAAGGASISSLLVHQFQDLEYDECVLEILLAQVRCRLSHISTVAA